MNMISTGAFPSEMYASSKQATLAEQFAAVWEKKNANVARAGGVSLMALSLAACGSSSSTTSSTTTSTTTTTTTTAADTIALTSGMDTVTGGAGDTTINALTEGHLEAADTITGGDGNDTLVIRDYDSSAGSFTMSGVETVNINFATASTLDLEDVTGLTSLVIDNSSTGAATVANAELAHALTLSNIASGGATTINIDFQDAEFDGASDTYSLTLDDVDDDLNLSLDTNGTSVEAMEALTIATGSNDNAGTIVLQDEGANAETVTITGSADAKLSGFLSGTVNAADATGDLTLTLGAEEQTITGGSGDDTFIFAGNLSYEDTVDGGAGTNSISLSSTTGAILSDAATGNVANVTNIQKLTTSGSLTSATITMSELSSLTTIEMDGASAGAVTIAAIPNNATIQVDDEISHTLTLSMAANTSADVLNLKLNEDIDGDIDTGNTYLNTLNITSAGTVDSTWHQIDMGGLTANTVTVAGAVAIDASNEAMATAVTQLDATAATANIKFTAGDNAGTEMLGGSAIDTFVGGSGADILEGNAGADVLTGGAGNDTISGGAGNDSITGGTGNDLLTGGAGDDKFIYTQLSTAVVADGEAFDGSASDGLINSTPDDITESTATSLTGGDFITDFVIGTDIIEIGGAMETAIETGQGAATQVLTTAGTADLTASGYFIVDNSLTTVSDFGDASVVMAAIDAALGTDHNGANADEMIITFSNTANTQHAVYFFYDADENAATTTDDGLSLLAIIDTPGDLLVTSVVDAN